MVACMVGYELFLFTKFRTFEKSMWDDMTICDDGSLQLKVLNNLFHQKDPILRLCQDRQAWRHLVASRGGRF